MQSQSQIHATYVHPTKFANGDLSTAGVNVNE